MPAVIPGTGSRLAPRVPISSSAETGGATTATGIRGSPTRTRYVHCPTRSQPLFVSERARRGGRRRDARCVTDGRVNRTIFSTVVPNCRVKEPLLYGTP